MAYFSFLEHIVVSFRYPTQEGFSAVGEIQTLAVRIEASSTASESWLELRNHSAKYITLIGEFREGQHRFFYLPSFEVDQDQGWLQAMRDKRSD